MDQQPQEERYQLEPADHDSPEKKFLRQWAQTVLMQAMNGLRHECEANANGPLFREANNLISGVRHGEAYAQISRSLHMGEGAVHRLRQRYGELLRREVAHTLASEAEVEEEQRYLFQVLSPVN